MLPAKASHVVGVSGGTRRYRRDMRRWCAYPLADPGARLEMREAGANDKRTDYATGRRTDACRPGAD